MKFSVVVSSLFALVATVQAQSEVQQQQQQQQEQQNERLAQTVPTFSILSPNNNDIIATQPNQETVDLTIRYSVPEDQVSSINTICFRVDSNNETTTSPVVVMKESCFPMGVESVTLGNLKPNKYKLLAVTTSKVDGSVSPLVERIFEVVGFSSLIPKLDFVGENLKFLANPDTLTGDVTIEYTIQPTLVNIANFRICGQLFTLVTSTPPAEEEGNQQAQLVQRTNLTEINCFEEVAKSFSLTNLGVGSYELYLLFQDKLVNSYHEPIKKISFDVVSLQENLPQFSLLETNYDLVVTSTVNKETSEVTTTTTELVIPFSLTGGIENSFKFLEICIELLNVSSSQLVVGLTCMPLPTPSLLRIQGLAQGLYRGSVVLRDARKPNVLFTSTVNGIVVEAQPLSEFLPSYDWQPLRRWHTIPYGLETRLPMSEAGTREARIPSLWKLQVALPSVCKKAFFLRAQVNQFTHLENIRNAAAELCDVADSCVELLVDGSRVPFESQTNELKFTVASTKLFSRTVDLLFINKDGADAACVRATTTAAVEEGKKETEPVSAPTAALNAEIPVLNTN